MKSILFICHLLVASSLQSVLFSQEQVANNPSETKALVDQETPQQLQEKKPLMPFQEAFLNLPKEKRDRFFELLKSAHQYLKQNRNFEGFAEIEKLDEVFAESPESYLLKGIYHFKIKSYDRAEEYFNRVQALVPDEFSARFNLAELKFVQHQWQEAEQQYSALLKNYKHVNDTSKLIEFKLLICALKLGKKDEAEILAGKYDYMDDSPFYYLAQALLAFEKGDENAADESIQKAIRIYGKGADTLIDSLNESGYTFITL